jgi:hypothetical protein
VSWAQTTPEVAADTHYLTTAGGVSLIATCGGTAAQPTVTLALTGLTQGVSYTATEVSNQTGTAVTTLAHGAAVPEQTVGATAGQITKVFDSETTTTGTEDRVSDLVTVVAQADDGTEFTASLDAELADSTAAASGPACTLGGTVAAA